MLTIPAFLTLDIVDDSFYDPLRLDEVQLPPKLSSWEKILKNLASTGVELHLSGRSEPVRHPEFKEFLALLKKHGLPFSLHAAAHEHLDWDLVASLRKIPSFRKLFVLFLSPHDKTNNPSEPKDEERMEESEALVKRASKSGLRTEVSVPMLGTNLNRLEKTTRDAIKLGASKIVFNRYLGPVKGNLLPQKSSIMGTIRIILQMREKGFPFALGNCFPQCASQSRSFACTAGRVFLAVDPFGNARPCHHSKTILGNLRESSLESLWKSKEAEKFRESFPEGCSACSRVRDCLGGCKLSLDIWGTRKDPLTTPLRERKPERAEFFHQAPLTGDFTVREEPSGPVLISHLGAVPVRSGSLPLLQALIQGTNPEQIQKTFGPGALEFAYSAFQRGFVDFLKGDTILFSGK
jgi:radical SAM protein with 4Fe4S-binding SPASM domain